MNLKFQDSKLQKNREIRRGEWEKFINDMSEKCSKVDQEFMTKKEHLKEYYQDLEKKLHIAL